MLPRTFSLACKAAFKFTLRENVVVQSMPRFLTLSWPVASITFIKLISQAERDLPTSCEELQLADVVL